MSSDDGGADEYVWEEVTWMLAMGWLCCTSPGFFALSSFDDVGPGQHPSFNIIPKSRSIDETYLDEHEATTRPRGSSASGM